MLEFLFDNLF